MKKIKKLLAIFTLLLTSCDFGSSNFSIEVYYLKQNDTTEYSSGETITYGENFSFDKFLVYQVSGDKKTLVKNYNMTFSGSEGLNESLFKSKLPEVGEYNFSFEYRKKYTGMTFTVKPSTTFPIFGVKFRFEDLDYLGEAKKPTISGFIDETYEAEYLVVGEGEDNMGEQYIYNCSPGSIVLIPPGSYYLDTTIYSKHYNGALIRIPFKVRKVNFPSDMLTLSGSTKLSFNYQLNEKFIGAYPLYSTYLIDKSTNQRSTIATDDDAYLSWKNPEQEISTTEEKTYTVVYHNKHFYDYEFDVKVTMSKIEVRPIENLLVDNYSNLNVKYDGKEHVATYMFYDYSGGWYIDEENTTLKATEVGTYQVVIKLTDPDNTFWKDTKDTLPKTYYWSIY